MKLCAIAVDYDGTIARGGALDPEVRRALAEVRARGITVVLVTGRILSELRRFAGDLHFVDVVVAENGGVVEFPDSGYSATLGSTVDAGFLEALRREHVAFTSGQCLVDTDAGESERILRIIRTLELPLILVFNRGRLMVLPQAISKATGLRHVLMALRLSPHNTIAVGDAENDHELLRICELGAAVQWGSRALQAAADVIVAGEGPPAVAGYLRTLAASRQIPAPRRTRRHLLVGHTDDGGAMTLAIRGRNVLVAGDPKSGKSWIAGLLCEQLILHGYCVCVLDPEGDYTSLQALPGVTVFGGADPLPRPHELMRARRHPDVSVVVDLSHVSHQEKARHIEAVLPGLATLRRHTGLPHRIMVDEAHCFLNAPDGSSLVDLELGGYTFVTYRASKLDPNVLTSNQAVIVTRESDHDEFASLLRLCGDCARGLSQGDAETLLGGLLVGEAVVLPITDEAEGRPQRIRLAPRLTPHTRHVGKYVDIPVTSGREFVFWRGTAPSGICAHTLREFVAAVENASPALLDGHLRRSDFSRWVAEVFGDYPLAIDLRRLEDRYRQADLPEAGASLARAIRARYEFVAGPPKA